MGLMERDYMKRTPEERAVGSAEYKKHQARQKEMYALFAKGENLTAKERKRLEEIYEENRRYITRQQNPTSTSQNTLKKNTISTSQNSKSKLVPVLIFIIVLLLLVLAFTYYPELGDLNLWN